MSVQIIVVLVVAALATVLVYLVVGRVLPGHWGKSEVAVSRSHRVRAGTNPVAAVDHRRDRS